MYDFGPLGVIYSSLHFALLSCIRYWLYKDNLRVAAKRMYAIVFSIMLGSGVIWILTGGVPGMRYSGFRVIMTLLMFLLSCFIIKEPLSKHAFSYAFIVAINASMETTATFAQFRLFPDGPAYIYTTVMFLLMAALFYPATRLLKRMITRLSELPNDRVWGYLCLCCFSFLIMNLMFRAPDPRAMSAVYPLSRYLMLLAMAGMYKATVQIMDALRASAAARAELAMTERRIAMQEGYYARLVSQMDDIRRMRHDLRHHRAAIAALVQTGDMRALSEYILENDALDSHLPVTGSLAADSVLLYYMDAAQALGVELETDLAIGGSLPLSTPDLCAILGNLLENAVEAQAYVAKERRRIRVSARGDAHSLTLAVDNRFDGTLHEENGVYRSRKEGAGHGLGIGSVRSLCEKYDGVLAIETEGDLFMAGVAIGL